MTIKPVRFILVSQEATTALCLEYSGQVTQVDETTVVCRTSDAIKAAQRIGTKIPDDE